jgi:hypothetical protein
MPTTKKTLSEEPSNGRAQRELASYRLHGQDVSPWRATGQEPAVFLDERGRRGVLVRALGLFGALVCAGSLALIVAGALAFVQVSPLPHGLGLFAAHAPRHDQGTVGFPQESAVRLEALARSGGLDLVGGRDEAMARRDRL